MKCEKHCQSSYTENYMLIVLGNWTYNEWSDPFFSSSFVVCCEKSYHCASEIFLLAPDSLKKHCSSHGALHCGYLWSITCGLSHPQPFCCFYFYGQHQWSQEAHVKGAKRARVPPRRPFQKRRVEGWYGWPPEQVKDTRTWCPLVHWAFQICIPIFILFFTTLTLISCPFSLWRQLRNYSYNPWQLTTAWHSEELRSCLSIILIHSGQGTTVIYLFIPSLVFYLPYLWHSKRETLWVGAWGLKFFPVVKDQFVLSVATCTTSSSLRTINKWIKSS